MNSTSYTSMSPTVANVLQLPSHVSAKALHDYEATKEDELSFSAGQTITDVTIHADGGWWEGSCQGRKGWFPDNFVEALAEDAAPPPPVKPAAPAPAPAGNVQHAKCTFDYDAVNGDELSLKTGDVIVVTKMEEEGWWEGSFNGKTGVFPSNFVEKCASPPKAAAVGGSDSPSTAKKPPVGGMGFGKSMFGPGGVPTLKKKGGQTQAGPPAAPASIPAPKPAAPAPAQPSAVADTREVVKVLFDYDAVNEDELGLLQGQFVRVLKREGEGWWEGELDHDPAKKGWFPDNFVGDATSGEVASCNAKKNSAAGGAAANKPPAPSANKPAAAKKPPAALKPPVSAVMAKKPSFSTKSKPPMTAKPAMAAAAAPAAAAPAGPMVVPKEVTDKLDEAMRLISTLQSQMLEQQSQMRTLQGQVDGLTADLDSERDLTAQLLKLQEKRSKAARA